MKIKDLIINTDAITGLRSLPDGCADMCVTSPPYYGLRDYGITGQIGLEKTPEEYIARLVEVFAEVRRVLRDDGTLWLNIGDSYAGGQGRWGGVKDMNSMQASNSASYSFVEREGILQKKWQHPTIKTKDQIGIPWMLAFALRADGWYLRQDIIWHKPNPMPESVGDRCTKAHEYIFLMSKNRKYYFNQIKEPCSPSSVDDFRKRKTLGNKSKGSGSYETARPDLCRSRENYMPDNFMRNKRSVWSVCPQPFRGVHFATFPPELIRPCILAGSRPAGIVLDPFFGAGTTGLVAAEHGREFIGVELNPDYCALARKRIYGESKQLSLYFEEKDE